jgi:5-methylcytosine-specific restriction endonuclease McrA
MALRALILNADYGFITLSGSWYESVCLMVRDRVEVLDTYDKVVRSEHLTFAIPSVLVLKDRKDVTRKRHSFTLASHKNILIREGFACAYCGAKVTLRSVTKDHVIPRCKGGKDVLTNVVAACAACNGKKADRTLKDSGMALRDGVEMRGLTEEDKLDVLMKFHDATERRAWLGFLKRTGLSLFTAGKEDEKAA